MSSSSDIVDIFRLIAERKIEEAIERGELDNLPLAGKRLSLDDLAQVPPELRMAYSLLKNAGVLPEELQLKADIQALRQALAGCPPDERPRELSRDLQKKEAHYNLLVERSRRGG